MPCPWDGVVAPACKALTKIYIMTFRTMPYSEIFMLVKKQGILKSEMPTPHFILFSLLSKYHRNFYFIFVHALHWITPSKTFLPK
jgi:hypothetical protein